MNLIRVVVYAAPELLRQLKAKLALKGLTVSEWFRRKAKEEIERED